MELGRAPYSVISFNVDAAEQFDDLETTLSHLFRRPHGALGGRSFPQRIVEALAERITSISVSQPTLEDVFLARTGHGFWESAE